MVRRVNYSGLVIAGVGFFLTRFTVTLVVYDDPLRFYLAGVVPLALGLGLAAFGVALTVADVEPSLVRTTATWCIVGALTMFALVVLTLLGSSTDSPALMSAGSRATFSNFLIGGSVGGTLTGLYAARTRRHRRELVTQTHRLEALNRLLRHEVLNAVTVIRGYASLGPDEHPDTGTVIEHRSDAIERTIEEVQYLTRTETDGDRSSRSVALEPRLTRGVEAVRERQPDAKISVTVDADPVSLHVRADDRLQHVVENLVENAVVHTVSSTPTVDVSVNATSTAVRVRVRDEGPGLPARQQALVETGDIGEFDDPRSGFGLMTSRFLVESYGGEMAAAVDERGTTVTVALDRTDVEETGFGALHTETGVRPAIPHLFVTFVAALLAGGVYGLVGELLGGSVAAIGVFYGISDPVVGWLTHQFHSVVFAFGFAGLVSLAPARFRNHVPAYALIGTAWGVFIWLVAASVIAPVWLRLIGIPAPVPNLSVTFLVNHLLWGLTLGVSTAWGYRVLAPRLTRFSR
jgi:signal transduction histidine kinase